MNLTAGFEFENQDVYIRRSILWMLVRLGNLVATEVFKHQVQEPTLEFNLGGGVTIFITNQNLNIM